MTSTRPQALAVSVLSTLPSPRRAGARHQIRCLAMALLPALTYGCTPELDPIILDTSLHNSCDQDSTPVDASAAEIQCLAESYRWRTSDAVNGVTIVDEGTNVAGVPVCCEVCAQTETADDACESTCINTLCDQAKDQHIAIGWELSEGSALVCASFGCGFSESLCQSGALAPQTVNFIPTPGQPDPDVTYALQVECEASALNTPGQGGLFDYVGELSSIPNAGPPLQGVTDVVEWCLGLGGTGGGTGGGGADVGGGAGGQGGDGADSTGSDGSSDTGGTAPPPVQGVPDPCGPFAQQRDGVRPSNNYASWNNDSTGVGVDGTTSYPMEIRSGGLEYTTQACPSGRCVRLDRLSAELRSAGDDVTVEINLRTPSDFLTIDAAGGFVVPAQALQLAARYEYSGTSALIEATNERLVVGTVDKDNATIRLADFSATSASGNQRVTLALAGDLINTQPETEIDIVSVTGTQVSLRANTMDSEGDPVLHSWMIPGVGSWTGDALEATLPVGRHAVVLYAEDVHQSRSLDAVWVEVSQQGS